MSIEQSLDPQLIEQTKQQIRALVAEIAQLSKSDITPEAFYSEFLTRVVSALAAAGGAVWARDNDGRLALQYQINLQETGLRESEESQAQHGRLLYKALACDEGLLVPPHSGPGEGDPSDADAPAANPTNFLLILGLLKTDLEAVGVVEVFQRAETGLSTQKGYLRFLMQMCELAGDFLKSHQLRHFSDRQSLWTQLEDFTRAVHASLDPREAAYTIANEGRRLIECDRVSVAIRKGKKCVIEAVSGQDLFDKRSNTVRLLGKLATAVVATGDAVWYTGDARDLAPQVEEAVEAYIDESHSKTVAVLPLGRPAPAEEDDPKQRTEAEAPIGALIVEQIEDSRLSPSLMQRAEVVRGHSSSALANALEHQNLFLMPVWRALGKTRWVFHARTLPKTLGIAGGVLLVILLLAVWPAAFSLESKGTLEPIERRSVFAQVDGRVDALNVEHGDAVEKDQLLARLQNTELDVAVTDIQGQRMANSQKLAYTTNLLLERRLSPAEKTRAQGEEAELRQHQQTLDAQWELYSAKQRDLDVKSPMKGVIVTWDLRNKLIGRPVQKGRELMRVANPDGDWQLELHMPEHRMGFIVEAQEALFAKSRKRFGELLREDAEAKAGEAANEAEIKASVATELEAVPDAQLRAKIEALLHARFNAGLQPILGEVADEEFRAKLAEISGKNTYDEAREALQSLLSEVADADLAARLLALPSEAVPDDRLEVSYVLATESDTIHYGRVVEIHRSAEIRGDEGNTVLMKVEINKADLSDVQIGATVSAKVACGTRSLGFVWLHDVVSFIQSRILFRYF